MTKTELNIKNKCSIMTEEGTYTLDLSDEVKKGNTFIILNKDKWYSAINKNSTGALFFQLKDVVDVDGKIFIQTGIIYWRSGEITENQYISSDLFPRLSELTCEPSLLDCMLVGTDKLKGG